MKKLLFIIPITLLLACKTESKKPLEPEIIKKSNKALKPEIIKEPKKIKLERIEEELTKPNTLTDSIIESTAFNFDYIKSNTSLLSKIINVNNINTEQLNTIPNKFIQDYITDRKKVIGDSISLTPDYPGAYRFFENKEFENFNLFTFTYSDESCCTYLYAATTIKDSLSIKDIAIIGYTGGDGGWIGEKYGAWYSEFGLGTTEVSNYDDDHIEDNNNSEIDTTWSEIQLSKKGLFKYIEHHKVKYNGNKQVE